MTLRSYRTWLGLAFAALLLIPSSFGGQLTLLGAGPGASAPVCTITAVNLSGNTFVGGSSSGTVVGTISSTTSGSCASDAFTLSGADAASFQIVGTSLETNGVIAAGSYSVNIVDTIAGATGSPFTQPETITGTSSGIAFDNAADLGNNGGSGIFSASYTSATLTHGLLVACFLYDFSDTASSVQYQGQTLTRAGTTAFNSGAGLRQSYLYYLLNPPSGAGTFTINASGGGGSPYIIVTVAEYSGVLQSAQPDSSNTGAQSSSAASITVADTIINANSWAMSCEQANPTSGTITGTTNATKRIAGAAFNTPIFFDSNAALGTGSQNVTVGVSPSAIQSLIVAAFQPG